MVKNLYGVSSIVLIWSFIGLFSANTASTKVPPINEIPISNGTVVYRVVATVVNGHQI